MLVLLGKKGTGGIDERASGTHVRGIALENIELLRGETFDGTGCQFPFECGIAPHRAETRAGGIDKDEIDFVIPTTAVFSFQFSNELTTCRLVEELGRGAGKDGQAQERAVDVQITRLRRKIEADPKQPRYLQTVRGEGYMLVHD